VKNTIEKLNSLLYSATKKRPDGPPSVLSGAESEKENKERDTLKSFLAETLAKQLVQKGMKDVTEYELHQIVYAIATKTSLDDGTLMPPPKYPPLPSPPPPQQQPMAGYDYYNQGYGNSNPPPGGLPPRGQLPPIQAPMMARPSVSLAGSRYSPPPRSEVSAGGSGISAAYATPIYNKEPASNPSPPQPKVVELDDNLDEFDDLTIEELRSLLDNFKNLSKGEQMDLIRYMKKLEQTDPEKVKLLKQSTKPGQKATTSSAAKEEPRREKSAERPNPPASSVGPPGARGAAAAAALGFFGGGLNQPPQPPPREEYGIPSHHQPPQNWGPPGPPPGPPGPPGGNYGGHPGQQQQYQQNQYGGPPNRGGRGGYYNY